ncbi:MAG: hypothetical protein EXS05_14985 [Planctomycetaceae bacterium]|nr:hypothetical protein [Planctomycetaceae bacterium]
MRARFVMPLAALVAVLAGWVWLRAESRKAVEPAEAVTRGDYYAVQTSGVSALLELPEACVGHCDLIIGSLGDSSRTYQVSLSTGEGLSQATARLAKVEPIEWSRARGRATGQVPPPGTLDATSDAVVRGGTPEAFEHTLQDRRFHLHVTEAVLEDPLAYVPVDATLAGEGRRVRVYCDRQLSAGELASGLVDEILQTLDERIIPRSQVLLGLHRDVDCDDKLAVLLTPWLGRLHGGRTSVNGFVRSGDFQPQGIAPYSNRCDVLYLNSNLARGPALTALLAHEYTHAVCCSLRGAADHSLAGLPDEADWLNEAIAHVAETLHDAGWSNLDRRIKGFLENPSTTPLVVSDYYRAGLWRDPGCRGATFLFLDWCVDGYGDGLLRDLACHSQIGVPKLEQVTGVSFAALYRGWTIALHQGRIGSLDLQGRVGECRLNGPQITMWNASEGTCELQLHGTATAFVRVALPPRLSRIAFAAEPGTRLQVTLVAGRPASRAVSQR